MLLSERLGIEIPNHQEITSIGSWLVFDNTYYVLHLSNLLRITKTVQKNSNLPSVRARSQPKIENCRLQPHFYPLMLAKLAGILILIINKTKGQILGLSSKQHQNLFSLFYGKVINNLPLILPLSDSNRFQLIGK